VLDDLNAGRRRAAAWYRRELAGVKGVTLPPDDVAGKTESVYHMFVIRLESNDVREGLAKALKEQGIETGVHYPVPNHQQPAITELYGQLPTLPKTEDYVKRILSLPMYPALEESQVKAVADAIKAYVSA
jgi:dTDP-4-amino-4,6-dideoxygalactose transaminase